MRPSSGVAAEPSGKYAGSVRLSAEAIASAERSTIADDGQSGGTGAGGRFTTLGELERALSGSVVAGQRGPEQCEPWRRLVAERDSRDDAFAAWQALPFISTAATLTEALAEARQRRRPLLACVLCLADHEHHARESFAFWNDALSAVDTRQRLADHYVCWAVTVSDERRCEALHRLLAAHALPVCMVFLALVERASLVDTFSCASLPVEPLLERLHGVSETYSPFLGGHTAGA